MASSPCGLFTNEVFVDTNGDYVGEFQIGDGPAGPFGWVNCMSLFDDETFYFGLFDAFKEPACALTEFGRNVYVPVDGVFGVQAARTVADASGPAGLEAVAAMEVDLNGAAGQHLAWAGPQVIDGSGDWVLVGELNTTTGWNPTPDDTWIFSCWAKTVPDGDGVDVAGATLDFTIGVEGFGESSVTAEPPLVLSDEWQFYQAVFNGLADPTGPWCWPIIRFSGDILKNVVTYERIYEVDPVNHTTSTVTLQAYAAKGRVHIKCPHLYQAAGPGVSTGNWIDNFHGHG